MMKLKRLSGKIQSMMKQIETNFNCNTAVLQCFKEDYNLEDLVIPPDQITKHLIEYRVRVLLKGDIIIYPGEEIVVQTACLIQKGVEGYRLHVMKKSPTNITI